MPRSAAAVALLCALLVPTLAHADPLETKLRAARSQASEAEQPEQASHPDAERRKQLERAPAASPGVPRGSPGPARSLPPPPADWQSLLVQQHDWQADLAGAGVSQDLQLTLGTPPRPYRTGSSYELYLALWNHSAAGRMLDGLQACGSLSRADGIDFRVSSDSGAEVVAPLVYKDTDGGHAHAALSVPGRGALRALVDLTQLAATSPPLAQLLLESSQVRVRAEIPALGLVSNEVSVALETR